MSFLAPLFLLGGLAVTLPILFHLARRSTRERQVFSSLMFLKPAPPRLTRRNRIEHWLLLLLRCVVICVLSLGFARPFFQKPIAPAPATGGSAHVVVLVDTSASMKREGLWTEALARAEAALRGTTPADQVAVLAFNDRAQTVVSFEQWAAMPLGNRPALAAQRLAELQPTWRATHLGNALLAAAQTLEDNERNVVTAGPLRIVLITDLQEGSRLDGVQGHDWPRGLEVVVETVKPRRPTNAGIQWLPDVEDVAQDAAVLTPRLRISNSTDAEREQFQVRWESVPGATSLDAYVPPGQSRVLAAPQLPDGSSGHRIVLNGDDHAFDNTVYVVQPGPEEINVLFLGEDSETDSAQSLYYLKRAFQDTRRRLVHLWNIGGASSLSVSPSDGEKATEDRLRGMLSTNRLVVISGTLAADHIATVRQFIRNKGSALFVMNDAASAKTLGELTGAAGVSASEATVANYAMFSRMDFEHPLLAPFADPRFGDFTKIRFWKHRRLSPESLPGARGIAWFDDDDPAILEMPLGRGRLFVFAFSWRPADSQFALSSKFVPLLYSLLDQAGGGGARVAQFRVGDTVDLSSLAAKTGDPNWMVRKPDGSQAQFGSGDAPFTQTDDPGIYEVPATTGSVKFAVNLDAAESKTAPLPVDELERLGLPLKSAHATKPVTPQPAHQAALRAAELEARQKVWRWLIVSALAVLLVETWLAGWLTRRSAASTEATI